jgi:photoactive yellow protein
MWIVQCSTPMTVELNAETLDSARMRKLSAHDYDQLAFGVIELDREFRVQTFNSTESKLAQRSPDSTIGRHFFREVAPCTDVGDFRGRIEELMRDGVPVDAEVRFDYEFVFPWGRRRVRIRALRGDTSCWVFVTPLSSFDRNV